MSIINPLSKQLNCDNVNVNGILSSNNLDVNITAPSGNVTTHFGPIIQGVYIFIPANHLFTLTSETRNSATVYYADLPLKATINKKFASSKISISCNLIYESSAADQNTSFVVRRLDSTGTFEEEVGTPSTVDTSRLACLLTGWWTDNDNNSTAQNINFRIVDGNVTSTGEYTYQVRTYKTGASTVALNRTRRTTDTSAGVDYEVGTSHFLLEEVL